MNLELLGEEGCGWVLGKLRSWKGGAQAEGTRLQPQGPGSGRTCGRLGLDRRLEREAGLLPERSASLSSSALCSSVVERQGQVVCELLSNTGIPGAAGAQSTGSNSEHRNKGSSERSKVGLSLEKRKGSHQAERAPLGRAGVVRDEAEGCPSAEAGPSCGRPQSIP